MRVDQLWVAGRAQMPNCRKIQISASSGEGPVGWARFVQVAAGGATVTMCCSANSSSSLRPALPASYRSATVGNEGSPVSKAAVLWRKPTDQISAIVVHQMTKPADSDRILDSRGGGGRRPGRRDEVITQRLHRLVSTASGAQRWLIHVAAAQSSANCGCHRRRSSRKVAVALDGQFQHSVCYLVEPSMVV